MKKYQVEGVLKVCSHVVDYWFRGEKGITPELAERLELAAEERAKECIVEGCVTGELNYEGEEGNYRGWWTIRR